MTPSNPLVVALDTDDLVALTDLGELLGPHVGALKIGLQAFTAHGPQAVAAVADHAPVFLDLKLHDIPNTVGAAAAAAARLGVAMLTVHASGGPRMIEAAVRATPGVSVLAVTVLTSLDGDQLTAVGQPGASEQVPRLAALAVEAGAGGVVCAPTEVAVVREAVGQRALLVTPGVRPAGSDRDDQARVATPAQARAAGADLIVVGRPVTQAEDPRASVQDILSQLEAR